MIRIKKGQQYLVPGYPGVGTVLSVERATFYIVQYVDPEESSRTYTFNNLMGAIRVPKRASPDQLKALQSIVR